MSFLYTGFRHVRSCIHSRGPESYPLWIIGTACITNVQVRVGMLWPRNDLPPGLQLALNTAGIWLQLLQPTLVFFSRTVAASLCTLLWPLPPYREDKNYLWRINRAELCPAYSATTMHTAFLGYKHSFTNGEKSDPGAPGRPVAIIAHITQHLI